MSAIAERMSRLEAIKDDPETMGVIALRLSDGERLKDIADAWQVPTGPLLAWVLSDEDRTRLYLDALKVYAHQLAGETVQIADQPGCEPGEVARDKLRIETRFRLAGYHDRGLYGEQKGSGGTRVNVIVQRATVPPPITDTLTIETRGEDHGDHTGSVPGGVGDERDECADRAGG